MRPHEPWIRLAQANIILGQPENACGVLLTASDFEPGLWEIWRDLTVVSARCDHFEKAAISYRKVLNINQEYGNEEILKNIVSSLVNKNSDKTVDARVRLVATKLFEDLLKIYPRNTNLSSLLGVVIASEPEASPCVRARAVKTLSKPVELIESPLNKWYLHDMQTMSVVRDTQLTVDCLVNVSHLLRGTKEAADCLKIALNLIDFVVTKLEDYHSDFLTRSVRHVFLKHYELLKEKSRKIKSLSK